MIVKIMGLVDLLAAAMLYFAPFEGFSQKIAIFLIIVLVVKGIPSLLG